MKGPVLMSAAITVALQAIVLSWILKIEKKCPCSVDWRRDYMKYMSIIMALNSGLNVFRPDLTMMLALPLLFAGLVNVGAGLTYIPDLKKRDCACAIEDEWRDNFIFWWFLLAVIFSILGGVFMLTMRK